MSPSKPIYSRVLSCWAADIYSNVQIAAYVYTLMLKCSYRLKNFHSYLKTRARVKPAKKN